MLVASLLWQLHWGVRSCSGVLGQGHRFLPTQMSKAGIRVMTAAACMVPGGTSREQGTHSSGCACNTAVVLPLATYIVFG
jgi:hypothetical protein